MVIVNVGEHGNVVIYKPAHELEEQDLTGTRNPAAEGEGFVIAVGAENSPGPQRQVRTPGGRKWLNGRNRAHSGRIGSPTSPTPSRGPGW